MSPVQDSFESFADADLLTRVGIALTLQDRPAIRDIRIEVRQGVVTLRGNVPVYSDRKLAYEVVRRVAGVRGVEVEFAGLHRVGRESRPQDSADETIVLPTAFGRVSRPPAGVLVAVGVLLLVLSGCNRATDRLPVVPVTGQITFDGQPLAQAFVVLHPKNPVDARHLAARGQTDAEGKFQLTTYEAADGATPGEYAVTVQYHQLLQNGESFSPGPNVLAPRIGSPESTDIVVRVAAEPTVLAPVDVRR